MNRDRRRVFGSQWVRWASVLLVGVAGLATGPASAPAQSTRDVMLLRPREARQLNQQAREDYDKAVDALDHVKPILAINHFNQASKLAPEAIELHFLTARLAHLRARMVFGSDEGRTRDLAEDYYDVAEQALQRVGQIPDLAPLTQRRYETQLKMVQEEKKALKLRDQQRKTVGETFRKSYGKERYGDEEEEEKKKEEAKKQQAQRRRARRDAGATTTAPAPRPRGGGGRRGADSES